MNELRITPEAEEELAAAVSWYEGRRPELGLEPIVEIDQTLVCNVCRN